MVVQVRFIAAIVVTIVTASVDTLHILHFGVAEQLQHTSFSLATKWKKSVSVIRACETMGKEGTVFPLYRACKDYIYSAAG